MPILASIPASFCGFLLVLASISINASYTGGKEEEEGRRQEARIGESGCTLEDLVILQGATGPLPDGIPSFMVSIYNLCEEAGCAMDDIHVACGWFASATLVDPRLFRREGFDDCVVNAGGPLAAGQVITFQYANSAPYPLSIFSASSLCSTAPPSPSLLPSPFPIPIPFPTP